MKTKKQTATEAATVEPIAQVQETNVTLEAAPVEAAPVEAVNYATLMQRGVKLPLDTEIVDAGGLVITLHDAGRAIVNGAEKHQLFTVCVSGEIVAVDGTPFKFTSPEVKAMLSASDYTVSTARSSRKGVTTISELTESVIASRYDAACEKFSELARSVSHKLSTLEEFVTKSLGCAPDALLDVRDALDDARVKKDVFSRDLFAAELRRQFEESAAAKAERKAAQKRVETAAAVAAADDATKRETLIATLRSCGCDVQTINASLAAAGFEPINA